jgi:hypothetical protein
MEDAERLVNTNDYAFVTVIYTYPAMSGAGKSKDRYRDLSAAPLTMRL